MKPNHEQHRAIMAPGDATTRVVAGAGTGKTTVLVQRYLKLVRDDGLSPSRVLALTFTLKAASEMRERIREAIREEMPERTRDLHGAWILNFHQFGHRLIRENAPAFGIDPDVGVMSPAEFRRIRERLRRNFLEGRIHGVPADFGGDPPPPTKLDSRFTMFFDIAEKCRGDMIPLEDLRHRLRDSDLPAYRAWVESVIAVGRAYEEELKFRNLIDFSDMITIPARGLSDNDELRRRYAGAFDHILVDEFQDTSAAQNDLLRALCGGEFQHITVVGDARQSIYRWRDARVENIRDFPGDTYPLTLNYRSRQRILDLAHGFITRDPDFAGVDGARLVAERAESDAPVVLFHPDGDSRSQDARREAAMLAAWVLAVTGRARVPGMPDPGGAPLGWDDVTILLRSLNASYSRPEIEQEFQMVGIPYAIIGGANAAESAALDLLHAWLSLLLPAPDLREVLTVLERAPCSLADASILELLGDRRGRSGVRDVLSPESLERVHDPGARERARIVYELRERMRGEWTKLDFGDFLLWALSETPFLLHLFGESVSTRAAEELIAELDETMRMLADHGDLNLPAFLEHIRIAVDDKKFREEGDIKVPVGRVRIMTMHQSKGLEFPAVAVAGQKTRNLSERFFVSRRDGLFVRESDKDDRNWGRGLSDLAEIAAEDRMTEQEDRCLLYVAMTRARDYLWVSSPRHKIEKHMVADVFSCAEAVDGVTVLREDPSIVGAVRAIATQVPAATESKMVAALDERARLRARRSVAPQAREMEFVTWSGVRAFSLCPQQHRFLQNGSYAPGLEERNPPTGRQGRRRRDLPGGLTPVQYGQLVHDALARWAQHPLNREIDSIASAVDRLDVDSDARTQARSAVDLLVKAVSAHPALQRGEHTRVEEPFQVRIGDRVFHGVFDRVDRRDDGWCVTDYKVGAADPAYEFQVQFYAWALARITGAPVAARLCYVGERGLDLVEIPPQIVTMDTICNALASSGAGAKATPGAACGECAWRGVCADAKID